MTRDGFSFALRLLAVAAPVLLGAGLGGCASSSPLAGVTGMTAPADAPPPPATPREFLPVHDIPPPRDTAVLEPAARDKLEKELLTARDRQVAGAKAAERRSGGDEGKGGTGGKASKGNKAGKDTKDD